MLYCYNAHLNVFCYFENEQVLERYNFLAVAPNGGGSCFEDAAWRNLQHVKCGCVTAAMLARWDFIQELAYDANDERDYVELQLATQSDATWNELEDYIWLQIHPLFSDEQDEL